MSAVQDGNPSRVPPHDLDAEAAVLSACMLSPEAMLEVRDILRTPAAFYANANMWLYTAICELDDQGTPVDAVTIAGWLRDRERLQQVGADYIGRLIDFVPAVANIATYANRVEDAYRVRRMINEATRIRAEGYTSAITDVADWCNDQVHRLAQIADTAEHVDHMYTADEAIERTLPLFRASSGDDEQEPIGNVIQTGYPWFDNRIGGGVRTGRGYVVAGRPGHGKTAWMLRAARNAAYRGDGALFLTAEMPVEDVTARFLAQEAEVDTGELEGGRLDIEGWRRVTRSTTLLRNLPLIFEDSSPQTLQGIRLAVRRAQAKLRSRGKTLRLVVIDYLQILKGDRRRGENREQEVAELSKALLVWLPRQIDCAVMLGSQLNRDKKRLGWQDYKLEDLRESGAIEQDAFGVFFVHRDDAEENDDTKHNGEADIVIGKIRQGGKRGRIQMKFNGPSTCFFEPADYETAYPEDQE